MKTFLNRRSRRSTRISNTVSTTVQALEQRVLFTGFTGGDLAVELVGPGQSSLGTLDSHATPVSIAEYATSGTGQAAAYTVSLPSTTGGSNPLTEAGSSAGDGYLTLSANGQYLVMPGYDSVVGTSLVAGTPSISREIGRIDSSGNINTGTTFNNAYIGNSIRSVASVDGTAFWTTGRGGSTGGGGVQYIALGGTSATQISSTSAATDNRTIEFFNGQLYISASTSVGPVYGVAPVGTGVPTTGSQSETELPGFPPAGSTASSYAFAFARPTTLYIADDNLTGTGGIEKWTFSSNTSNWSMAYSTLAAASNSTDAGMRGLTMDSNGNLYGTTSAPSANRLVAITDTGSGFTFTTLATAPTNEVFRGVALAPQATTPLPVISTQPTNQSGVPGSNVSFTAASYGTPVPTVQWYQSIDNGATFQLITGNASATTSTLTLSSVSLSQNNYKYEAKFTNSAGTTTTNIVQLKVSVNPQLSFDSTYYSVNENAGTVNVTVDRTGDTSTSVTVVYTTSDGSALAGTNYTTESHTLTFPAAPTAGYASQSFSIPILAAYPQNGNKSFTITLSNPQGDSASLGDNSTTTVNINDVGEVFQFGSASYNVNQTSGVAFISVVRNDILTDSNATVHYATSNGTAGSSNYTATSGTLIFPAGQLVENIQVPISGATQTQNLTFTLTLSNPTAGAGSGLVAVLGTQSTATENIINAAALTNNLSGVAASDTDIEDTGPYPAGWTLVVGDESQYPGTELGFDELSVLEFSPAGSPGLYPAPGYAVSAGGLSNLSLSMQTPTDASYHPLISGNFNVYFLPDSDATTNTNHLTYNKLVPTGLDPTQFAAVPQLLGTFSFQGGLSTAAFDTYTPASLSPTISNEIIADLNAGSSFRLAVTPQETGVGAISTRIEGVFTDGGGNVLTPVLDVTANVVQTAAPETLALSSSTYSASETAGTANITLTRTGATYDTATVTYTLNDGTAVEGTNYGVSGTFTPPITGVVTFLQGHSTASFNVPIINVANQNGDKALTITLSNPTSDSNPGPTTLAVLGQSSSLLTIKDSSAAPTETLDGTTTGAYAARVADVETTGPFQTAQGGIDFKIAGSGFYSYAVADFNDGTVLGPGPNGVDAYVPTKPITAINSITLEIFNNSGGTSGPIDVYLVPDASSTIAPGTTVHTFDSGTLPEGLDYSGTNSFGTPLLLGKINWNSLSPANTFINFPLLNYSASTANTLISDLNNNTIFRIVATPESSAVAANWGSLTGTFDGNPEIPVLAFGVQEGVVNTLPAWLAAGSNATWTAGTHSLVVHGAATIIADPLTDEPVITTDGGAASVLTITPASGRTVHIGGLILTGGATATVTSVGTGRAAGTQLVLVVAAGTNNFSISSTSKLDLVDNDAVFLGGSTSSITGDLKLGFNANTGYWNGAGGIVSSAAAGDTRFLTALGTAPGSVASGSTFDTVTVGASDVLVKYTYYGDADLTGTLNGADYQQIDSGFGTHATIWSKGDFNYDALVDGSDFSLIDNTFNQINAKNASPLALTAGASEPAITAQHAVMAVFSNAPITSAAGTEGSTSAEDLLNGGKKTLADEVLDDGI